MKKCPVCGEQYADTYRRCPFCEEDERASRRRQRYAGGGRRGEYVAAPQRTAAAAPPPPPRSREYEEPPRGHYRDGYRDDEEYRNEEYRNDYDDYGEYDEYDDNRGRSGDLWFKIIMGILIAIILACLLYLGRGIIGNMLGGDAQTNLPSSSQGDDAPSADEPDTGDPDGRYDPTQPNIPNTPSEPTDPGTTDPEPTDPEPTDPEPTTPSGTTTTTPAGTTTPNTSAAKTVDAKSNLSHYDVMISPGETFTLKPKGVTTKPTYTSGDSSIATVDASGKVTGVKKGTTKVTVTWDGSKAECIVRVKAGAVEGSENAEGTTGTVSGTLKLNKDDFTMNIGETVSLKATGATDVTWSIGDSSIATVDGNGKIKGVKKGTTTVTVSAGGQTAKCIVRVK